VLDAWVVQLAHYLCEWLCPLAPVVWYTDKSGVWVVCERGGVAAGASSVGFRWAGRGGVFWGVSQCLALG